MSYWNSREQRIIEIPPEKHSENWIRFDCGCSGGLRWGGEYPVECYDCEGWGFLYLHVPSGSLAVYPGGRFVGSMCQSEVEAIAAAVSGSQ
jgi:hypothetical protein